MQCQFINAQMSSAHGVVGNHISGSIIVRTSACATVLKCHFFVQVRYYVETGSEEHSYIK